MPSQYRAIWATPGGGTGYSVFHCLTATSSTDAQGQADAIRAFFFANRDLFPDDVSFTFDDEVIVLDVTGNLIDVYPVTPPGGFAGTQTTVYNRAAGIRIDWNTGEIVVGRRLTGRTFMVPAAAGAYDSSGLVNSATISAVQTTATNLITALSTKGTMCVWSRTHATQAAVTSGTVPNKGAILRGRRD